MTTLPSMIGAPWRPHTLIGVLATSEGVRGEVDGRGPGERDRAVVGDRRGDEWVSCAECGMEVRADRLSQHRATQH